MLQFHKLVVTILLKYEHKVTNEHFPTIIFEHIYRYTYVYRLHTYYSIRKKRTKVQRCIRLQICRIYRDRVECDIVHEILSKFAAETSFSRLKLNYKSQHSLIQVALSHMNKTTAFSVAKTIEWRCTHPSILL